MVFQVSTDGGTKWQKIEPGREVMLDEPGTEILVKVLLLIDPATVLYDYRIDINPYHDMSFTGKFLEPEIGLIYFGGRWYEPGIGRWVTVDPAEDGENWYGYCRVNPINNFDPDGFISLPDFWRLLRGVGEGFKIYAPKKALDVAKSIALGSLITVGMSYIMPILPGAIPVIVGAIKMMGCISTIPFILDIGNDFQFLYKRFTQVFCSKDPPRSVIREYGIRISKVALDFTAMIASQVAMKEIIKTGVLQRIGFKFANSTRQIGATNKGKAGHAMSKCVAEMRGEKILAEELTLKTDSATFRVDIVSQTKSGDLRFIEAKFGSSARLTYNQRIGYPEMAATGGIVQSTKYAMKGLPYGKIIGPTTVNIDWW